MWFVLGLSFAEKAINRIIDTDFVTRQQLNDLQNESLTVVIKQPYIAVDVLFDEGKIRLSPSVYFSVKENLSPLELLTDTNTLLVAEDIVDLLKLLLSDERNIGNIPVYGDHYLLIKLKAIMQSSELDFASHLVPYIGASAANELARLQDVPKYLWQQAQNLAYFMQDYLKEDSGLFAPRWKMDKLQKQTRQLNQEIERLEAKIIELQSQIKQKSEK